ncbi:hypothetical protein CsatB_017362 [Cannabis sativa]
MSKDAEKLQSRAFYNGWDDDLQQQKQQQQQQQHQQQQHHNMYHSSVPHTYYEQN